jgi:hypothetical protein
MPVSFAGRYVLRGRNRRVISLGEPQMMSAAAGEPPASLIAIPLAGVPPGDYDLVFRVEDRKSGQRRERGEALRVAESGPG